MDKKTQRLVIELIPADPDGNAAELWEDMKADFESDPNHQLTLETRNWIVDAKIVREVRA